MHLLAQIRHAMIAAVRIRCRSLIWRELFFFFFLLFTFHFRYVQCKASVRVVRDSIHESRLLRRLGGTRCMSPNTQRVELVLYDLEQAYGKDLVSKLTPPSDSRTPQLIVGRPYDVPSNSSS